MFHTRRRKTVHCSRPTNKTEPVTAQLSSANALQLPRLGTSFEAAIIRLFRLGREAAAGKLPAGEMVLNALAANAPLAARSIRATAPGQIFLFLALHGRITPYRFGFTLQPNTS